MKNRALGYLFAFPSETGLHFAEVSNLRRKGLPAVSWTSDTPKDERDQVSLLLFYALSC